MKPEVHLDRWRATSFCTREDWTWWEGKVQRNTEVQWDFWIRDTSQFVILLDSLWSYHLLSKIVQILNVITINKSLLNNITLRSLLCMSALSEDVHSSPNTVRVTKSRRMGRAGHFTRIGGEQVYTGFWWGNLRERDHLGGPGVYGRILLSWIFRKWEVRTFGFH